MKTTTQRTYRISILRTFLRFGIIAAWFVVMLYASYMGLFFHAFIGMLGLSVLTYLMIKQFEARSRYIKKKRAQYIQNYHIGEDYLKVFSANK